VYADNTNNTMVTKITPVRKKEEDEKKPEIKSSINVDVPKEKAVAGLVQTFKPDK